jgi:hypothetical protein
VASNLGVGSVPAKLAKSLVYGVPFDVPGAIVQLAAPIPLVGDITSVYFTGRAEGDPALYGTGLNGLVAYSGTLLPWLKPLLGPAGRPQQAAAAAAVEPVEADVPAGPEVLAAEEVRVVVETPEPVSVEIARTAPAETPAETRAETPEPALDESLAPTAEPEAKPEAQPEAQIPDAETDFETDVEPDVEPDAGNDEDKPAQRSGYQGRRGLART